MKTILKKTMIRLLEPALLRRGIWFKVDDMTDDYKKVMLNGQWYSVDYLLDLPYQIETKQEVQIYDNFSVN